MDLEFVQYENSPSVNLQLCPKCNGTMVKECLNFQVESNYDLPPFFWASRSGSPLLHAESLCTESDTQIAYRCRHCDVIVISKYEAG